MNRINFLINEIKKEKELVKDSFWMFLANAIPAIMGFLMNLILARIFNPEPFGNYKTVTYLITFFSALISFGIPITLTKYIAQFRVKDKKKIGYMTRWFLNIRLISFSALFLILLVFLKPITVYFLHDPSLSNLILAGFPLVFATIFGFLPSMVLGYENFKLYFFSKLVTSIGYILFVVGLGYFSGVPFSVIGLGISNLLGSLLCLKYLNKKGSFRKTNGKFNVKEIFLKFSLPMYIFTIPSFFGNAVVPVLSIFFSPELIGQYSFSFVFYYSGLVIPSTIGTVLLPRNSRLISLKDEKNIKKTLIKVFSVYTLIAVVGILGVFLLGRTVLSIIAPEYLPGLVFFKALVSLGLISGYIIIYNSYLTAKEELKWVALLTLIQNLLIFLVSFLLLKSV
ncbi:MAG: oligosaccharide flippase family protein [Candidatus Aenigmarchaeota archaeon]|nr:oligosaccharide flippase family protein [Candidatus Aenigmarchaeota archaeon]